MTELARTAKKTPPALNRRSPAVKTVPLFIFFDHIIKWKACSAEHEALPLKHENEREEIEMKKQLIAMVAGIAAAVMMTGTAFAGEFVNVNYPPLNSEAV